MRIGLHTLGDPTIGMGHVFRCLALANALAVRFPGSSVEMLLDEGIEGWALTQARFGGSIRALRLGERPGNAYDLMIVDRLQVPLAAMEGLRRDAHFLVSLDDVGAGRWMADLAVGALYLPRSPRPTGNRTRSVDGPSMLAIDASFAAAGRGVDDQVRELLITQGGSDTYGLVPKLVWALAPWLLENPSVTAHIHTGPAFRHEAELALALVDLPRVERHVRVPELASLYADMDLAVAAAGVTTCELAAVGVPLVVVTGEEKELETAAMLEAAGAARVVGLWREAAGIAVASEVASLAQDHAARAALSMAARVAVDGRGLERLVNLIADGLEGRGSSS